ncbi:MAG: iron complex transport system substrate-binding protein [Solirubrobacteraceae bacterium]|nr:iron complex transport system substrate-binding protein [Solirubrobacteraceae bacterium]
MTTLRFVRIVSLVPHATELLFALGLGDQVVAVTHECDYPEAAQELPTVTRDLLPSGLSSGEIDAAVRERTARGESIYELDEEELRDAEPDLIVTQALCMVCAVSVEDVRKIADDIPNHPRVLSLDPRTFGETLGDVRTVAQLTDSRDAALELIARTRGRVDRVRLAVRGAERPAVAALEWLDPVFIAGHWTPQLIEMAGGQDVLGFAGEQSEQSSWDMVRAAQPEVVLVMPCGYDVPRSYDEALEHAGDLRSIGARDVVAVDAKATFSRPGPRLVDGLELLAHTLHPDLFEEPVDVEAGRPLTVELA